MADFIIPGREPRSNSHAESLLGIASSAILLVMIVVFGLALAQHDIFLALWQQDASAATYPAAALALLTVNLVSAWHSTLVFRGVLLAQGLVTLAFWGLAPALAVVALLLCYALAGNLAIRLMGIRPVGTMALPLVLGLIGFGWIMQGLAFLPVHGVVSYSLAVALVLLAGRTMLAIWARSAVKGFVLLTGQQEPTMRMAMSVAASTAMFFAYVTHIPELGTDALMTHLAVMSQIARDWRFIPDIGTFTWAYIPKPMHFGYLPALVLGGENGVRCLHVALGIAAAVVVGEGIYQAGGRRVAWLVVAFVLGSPLMMHESASIFVETYLSLLSVVGTLALTTAWKDELPLRGTALAGIVFGGAAAAKLHGLVFAPLLGAVLLAALVLHRFKSRKMMAVAIAALAYIAVALPSFALPWVATGNPLFPYFNDFFHSPFFSDAAYHFNIPRPPLNIGTWVDMAVNAAPYLEAVGPMSMFHVYFLAPLVVVGLLFWRRAEFVIPATLGLGHIAIVLAVQNYLRYQTAGFFVISIAGGIAMAWLWQGRLTSVAFGAMTAVVVLANAFYAVASCYQYRGVPIWKLATRLGQEQLETSRAPERAMLRVADSILTLGERVAVFWYPLIGLSKNDALLVHPFFGNQAWQILQSSISTRDFGRFFATYHISHVVIRHGVHFEGSDALRMWLTDHTDIIAESDGADLLKLRETELFPRAIISNEDSITSWDRDGSPAASADGQLLISGKDLALKFFKIEAGETYLLSVRANCRRGDYFWLHINWYDEGGKIMKPEIFNRQCERNRIREYHAMFLPPPGAASGAVVLDSPQETEAIVIAAILSGNHTPGM